MSSVFDSPTSVVGEINKLCTEVRRAVKADDTLYCTKCPYILITLPDGTELFSALYKAFYVDAHDVAILYVDGGDDSMKVVVYGFRAALAESVAVDGLSDVVSRELPAVEFSGNDPAWYWGDRYDIHTAAGRLLIGLPVNND